MNRAFSIAALTALVLVAVACAGSTDNVPAQAVLAVDRELPDGGAVVLNAAFVGTTQNETFQIINDGRATLNVSNVRLTSPGGGTPGAGFPFAGLKVAVTPGSDGENAPWAVPGVGPAQVNGFVRFTFAPTAAGKASGEIRIDSDDKARPHVVVPFSACAVAVGGSADAGC